MSSPTQRYSPLPPMPTHSDEDQFDYHYILVDLTVDPPIYNWKLTSKSKRRALGDLSKEESINKETKTNYDETCYRRKSWHKFAK